MSMKEYAVYGIGMCLTAEEFEGFCMEFCSQKGIKYDEYFDINEYTKNEVLDLNDGWASGITAYNVATTEKDEPERLYVFQNGRAMPIFRKEAYKDLDEIVLEIETLYADIIPAGFPVVEHICEYSAAVVV